jgi:methionyl-tRNA formyltransferase
MRLIFMGTPEFAVPTLARLIKDGHDVAAVFTQPDKPSGRGKHLHAPPVKTLAGNHGVSVYQPAKIKTNEEVRALFESIAPDACIVAAYGKILPEWLLAIPRLGCINVHASLLPKYRGAAPINWAIANGETETGITIMQMDKGMDTGPMLARRSLTIGDDDTAVDLSTRLSELGAELLSDTLPRLERGELVPEPQDNSLASYAPLLKRDDGLIDWDMPAAAIANRVRAFQPWPASYTWYRGGRLTIWRATPAGSKRADRKFPDTARQAGTIASSGSQAEEGASPGTGTLINNTPDQLTVLCGGGTLLLITDVQPEGKRRMTARDFVNGARAVIGERLVSG